MDSSQIMAKLQAPFTPEEIEWRVGSKNSDNTKGLALAYVTNRAIQDRLDNVFGIFGWKNEFKEWKGSSQLCGLSILIDGQWITKWDGADDSNMEAVKGGLSDAMKRAAYQWGIGRYLYKLPEVWTPIEKRGNSFVIKTEPQLPKWALPEGYQHQPGSNGNANSAAPATTQTRPTQPVPTQNSSSRAPQEAMQPTSQGRVLSEAQIKRFYAISHGSKAGDSVIRAIIENMFPNYIKPDGKLDWDRVSKQEYDNLCNVFQAGAWQAEFEKIMAIEASGIPESFDYNEYPFEQM